MLQKLNDLHYIFYSHFRQFTEINVKEHNFWGSINKAGVVHKIDMLANVEKGDVVLRSKIDKKMKKK